MVEDAGILDKAEKRSGEALDVSTMIGTCYDQVKIHSGVSGAWEGW